MSEELKQNKTLNSETISHYELKLREFETDIKKITEERDFTKENYNKLLEEFNQFKNFDHQNLLERISNSEVKSLNYEVKILRN